jgi:hypothetical protein
MMSKEQIQTRLGYATVYLVEARSIGGISGSPAFVRPTLNLNVKLRGGDLMKLHGVGSGMALLGLMHGHWDIEERRKNNPEIIQDDSGVNLGVGIVVPATKILEVINQPMLKKFRNDLEKAALQSKIPGTDSAKPRPMTQEEFDAALKKASRKIAPTGKKTT